MWRRIVAVSLMLLGAVCGAVISGGAAHAQDGQVSMPLREWLAMSAERGDATIKGDVAWLSRHVLGRFDEGLFSGQLDMDLEVVGTEPALVPVIDDDAAIGEVLLDGSPTALVADRQGRKRMYRLPDVAPGRHTLSLRFHLGEQTRRYNQQLKFRLPDGGATAFSIHISETEIEPSVRFGVVRDVVREGRAGTLVRGYVGGYLDLAWKRRAANVVELLAPSKLRATQHTLLTISEALVTGRSAVDFDVLDGETDRVELALPPSVEILNVEGEAVLQWRTVSKADGPRLAVLLRHLVSDGTRLLITFQLPVLETKLTLALPVPTVPTQGVVGVRGPTGLAIAPVHVEGATTMMARELPEVLTEMAATPVLFGFQHAHTEIQESPAQKRPVVIVEVKRQEELELTTTLVDELQASTVILEGGRELTKLKLRIRNNSRQYLTVTLPQDATLTHSLIDGRQVRPAISDNGLLFPLRQSERLGSKHQHVVRPGETLSDVANLYYSDPSAWRRIRQANHKLIGNSGALETGHVLTIPRIQQTQETSFVVELAYERAGGALGWTGRRGLTLPTFDVDTVRAVWHVYVPRSHAPIAFSGNLTQVSRVSYDPFRRLKFFLERALSVKEARADDYKNILSTRRKIYREEATSAYARGVALTSFPLVGERYRFRRVLLGREQPSLAVIYADASLVRSLRWGAMALAFLVLFWALTGVDRWRRWLIAGIAVCAVTAIAHHVRGVHMRLVWAADLALIAAMVRQRWPQLREHTAPYLASPWSLLEKVSIKRWLALAAACWLVGVLASYPMLLSLGLLVGLSIAWWAQRGRPFKRSRRRGAAAVAAMLVLGVATTVNAGEPTADELYDKIMNRKAQSELQRNERANLGGTVTLPLSDVERAHRRPHAAESQNRVTMGAARYEGEVVNAVMQLDARIDVVLGGTGLKEVPLVGNDVVLVAASVDGQPIAVTRRPGYHVWLTRRQGPATIKLHILVGARGPRGSIEYSFRSVRATSASLRIELPKDKLEPRFDGAMKTTVRPIAKGTEVEATLPPTTRVRMIGFHDLGEEERRDARVFAESASLLSVDRAATELFVAVRYTILHAETNQFNITLPDGFEVVSADGEGAFRWQVDDDVIRGETARPIKGRYEVSLRLRRAMRDPNLTLELPRCLGVERQHGWLGVEVPGKLQLEDVSEQSIVGIDIRQLPTEVLDAAVSPILHAYRYHHDAPAIGLEVSQLPERELASDAIDRIEAVSVLSGEGKLVTQLNITLRNSVKQSLAIRLADDTKVRSTLLNGKPVKPSRRDDGAVLLPLKRSSELVVVIEQAINPLGLSGMPALSLPTTELPVASVKWQIHLPAKNTYGALTSDVSPQALWGTASWHKPPHDNRAVRWDEAASNGEQSVVSGENPVRFELPTSGISFTHQRYWVGADETVAVSVPFVRSWVLLPLQMLVVLLLVFLGVWTRMPTVVRYGAATLSLAALWWLDALVVGACALLLGLTIRWLSGIRYARIPRVLRVYILRTPSRFRVWRRRLNWTPKQYAVRGALLLAFAVVGSMLGSRTMALLETIAFG